MESSILSFQMPKNACNSHLHIIDPKYPNNGKAAAQKGTVEEYRKIAEKLGFERAVFVQAKVFGTDNTCLTDAIAAYGRSKAKGIAVVNNSISDAELRDLERKGVVGLRFSLWNPKNAVVSYEDCLPLAKRIADMGWHVQLHMGAAQLLEHADDLKSLPCPIVIDHMGRLDPAKGTDDPAFRFICSLIDAGHTWVKLSGPYLNTTVGRPWPDAAKVAKAIASYAPERVVFGTDFPHTTEKIKPSEIELTELAASWFPTAHARELALVKNPEELYGFGK
ncbi:MAG: amidohydrolase family protein [Acidaminococcus sp.]|jgi:predicted TIM-barrel fold metal-dependent hydrolase|nr:amidohydrolase family protein [Acidaminococcus sp.]MCI2100326.1 amidohydrolase family protein [Acidaminococcus sp.]MCI2114647.1 amidohydrolase family protein [Acidaminococcus sp.]MCI2116701.1 amidohydrolase family protein [Acidaminococcus sp.]